MVKTGECPKCSHSWDHHKEEVWQKLEQTGKIVTHRVKQCALSYCRCWDHKLMPEKLNPGLSVRRPGWA